MRIQEERVFRIPVDELRLLLRSQYGVDLTGVEPYLDGDSIVFAMRLQGATKQGVKSNAIKETVETMTPRIRRRRRKRNRMRTRGWNVVGKIKNSYGLTANVYGPLVEELRGREIVRSEQRKIVRQLLISNGNEPSNDSVDYFLDNTLEYLAQQSEGGEKRDVEH